MDTVTLRQSEQTGLQIDHITHSPNTTVLIQVPRPTHTHITASPTHMHAVHSAHALHLGYTQAANRLSQWQTHTWGPHAPSVVSAMEDTAPGVT